MPPRGKIQPQQARQFVPTETRDNASHSLLRDAPNPPNLNREKCSEKSTLIVPKLELVKQAGKQYAKTGEIDVKLLAEICSPMIPEDVNAGICNGEIKV